MKMTFSMCRNAVNGERFLEMSKLQSTTLSKNNKGGSSELSSVLGSQKSTHLNNQKNLPPLMRKELALDDNELVSKLLGTQKKRSKREEQIDMKIEQLLESYKK